MRSNHTDHGAPKVKLTEAKKTSRGLDSDGSDRDGELPWGALPVLSASTRSSPTAQTTPLDLFPQLTSLPHQILVDHSQWGRERRKRKELMWG